MVCGGDPEMGKSDKNKLMRKLLASTEIKTSDVGPQTSGGSSSSASAEVRGLRSA